MTHIHFEYSDAYGSGSRGSLAFTPHRRHASNETEILPKPFTVPLLNGEVTVDLQPNPSTWVWIITEYFEQRSESFYITIPDSDGVVEAVDLIRINPSTIPAPYNAVEPVWWAEMRQYKQTVTETLLKAGEALESSESSLEESAQNRDESRQSAANAKAYYEQSRDSAYESKEYRDQSEAAAVEAERQADRAASGPESAAGRAETARDESEQYRDEAREFRDAAQSSANDARDDAQSASQHNSDAYNSARDADTAQETAETYRDEAQVARDELLAEPDALMDLAQDAKDTTQQYLDEAEKAKTVAREHRDSAATRATESETARDDARQYRDTTQQLSDDFDEKLENIVGADDHGEWVEMTLTNDFEQYSSTPLSRRLRADGSLELNGVVTAGDRSMNSNITEDLGGFTPFQTTRLLGHSGSDTVPITVDSEYARWALNDDSITSALWINGIIPAP